MMIKGWFKALFAVFIGAIVVSASLYWSAVNEGRNHPDDGGDAPLEPSHVYQGGGYFALTFTDPMYVPSSLGYDLPLDILDVLGFDRVNDSLELTTAQLDFLKENGFVGLAQDPLHTHGPFTLFYDVYEWLDDDCGLPLFVTSDLVLDAYHLVFERVLKQLEEGVLYNVTLNLSLALMLRSDMQRMQLAPEHQRLAELNVAFFGAAARMLDPDAEVPAYAEEEVTTIVGFAEAADGYHQVNGFHKLLGEDFTQYKPRGHYTQSEQLGRYFRAMMWYGRMTFWGKYDDETQRAVLISQAIRDDPVAFASYVRLSSVIDFMVGAPDDLTYLDYVGAIDAVLGPMGPHFDRLFDSTKLMALEEQLKSMRPPRILSDVAFPGDWPWGLRVLGQRFVLDSYVFQNCVYSKVPSRDIPSGTDVMAALGSAEAWDREPLAQHAPALEKQLGELKTEVTGYNDSMWNQSLYWAWLHSLQALHGDTSGNEYPPFMRTEAWRAKELNTQLASWTQLTHDTLLYRKQSNTEYMGGSPPPGFVYVEPVPELYSRMGDMVRTTREGLRALDLASPDIETKLTDFQRALDALERVAVAELKGKQPTADDLTTSRQVYNIPNWEEVDAQKPRGMNTVLVSDVHTDPNSGQCLEEGVGYARLMVLVAPTKDGPTACIGAVFEHHEFTRSLSEGRLTDEEWMTMLTDGTAPAPAPWVRDFMA